MVALSNDCMMMMRPLVMIMKVRRRRREAKTKNATSEEVLTGTRVARMAKEDDQELKLGGNSKSNSLLLARMKRQLVGSERCNDDLDS